MARQSRHVANAAGLWRIAMPACCNRHVANATGLWLIMTPARHSRLIVNATSLCSPQSPLSERRQFLADCDVAAERVNPSERFSDDNGFSIEKEGKSSDFAQLDCGSGGCRLSPGPPTFLISRRDILSFSTSSRHPQIAMGKHW